MSIVSDESIDTNPVDQKELAGVVRIEVGKIRSHVDELVRSTAEATLNAILDAEADGLCGARRYERSPDRVDTRAGRYQRKLVTKAGEVKLVPPPQMNQSIMSGEGAGIGKPSSPKSPPPRASTELLRHYNVMQFNVV